MHSTTRRRVLGAAVALSAAASLLGAASSSAVPPRGQAPRTEIVSTTEDGTRGNSHSYKPRSSYDGRYVAFETMASNLVPGDTNDTTDVLVRDRRTGTLTRVGVGDDGRQSKESVDLRALSGDGRVVGFDSRDPALAPGERPPAISHAYVRDLRSRHTEFVAIGPEGKLFEWSRLEALSGDGRYAAFFGYARIPGPPFYLATLYVRDRERGLTDVISEDLYPGPLMSDVSMSADGRHVAFRVYDHDRYGVASAVYVRDRRTGRLHHINHTPGDPQPVSDWYFEPSLSADGRFIAYVTNRDGLSAPNPHMLWEIFVHDLRTGRTVLASTAPDGGPLNKPARSPQISPEGRYVGYTTLACATGEPDCKQALYLRDLRRDGPEATRRITVAVDGGFPSHGAGAPAPAHGGCLVAFASPSTNLIPDHPEQIDDVYIRHLC
ncbi:PD40 domain-containing protein [Streptomyces sp. YIM 121038]|uniref:PD40 domain-containing protein n=1 Tax=Streptomyces sp. YIM 121038 TaxID=2136401 RepID=UPI001485D5DC|nr:PD40 domain-containing protein [Streptomyces sp. YIM 121038]